MSPLGPVPVLINRLRSWPVESQLAARRNAMLASTAMAARRAERLEVEEFFASLEAQRAPHRPPHSVAGRR